MSSRAVIVLSLVVSCRALEHAFRSFEPDPAQPFCPPLAPGLLGPYRLLPQPPGAALAFELLAQLGCVLLESVEVLTRIRLDAAGPCELLAVLAVRPAPQRMRWRALQLAESPDRRFMCLGSGVTLGSHTLELGDEALLAPGIGGERMRRRASQRRRELFARRMRVITARRVFGSLL